MEREREREREMEDSWSTGQSLHPLEPATPKVVPLDLQLKKKWPKNKNAPKIQK
jgi:hypothetical protein